MTVPFVGGTDWGAGGTDWGALPFFGQRTEI
ncbi:hypothetical protein FHS27_004267 [Rhodopirellula rubra]|uniref:Uncharacterized protein n=1 Tax=Aporhodopirellula rubra TaxID=980271 RepID=A0A7W5E1G6_9BACT|nr:hypothetical protein [Aporhodopirellula rubra]